MPDHSTGAAASAERRPAATPLSPPDIASPGASGPAGESAHALLTGLALRLNTHLTGVRRNLQHWDEDRLRRELALAAAMVDCVRATIGEDAIAARAEEAREHVQAFEPVPVGPAAGYALWSRSYDGEMNPVIALEEPVLGELLGDVAGRRVLDVGSGTGRWALRLAAQGAHVTGVEPCPEMLAIARHAAQEQGLAIDWIATGFGDLPREPAYDLVVCNLVLCHLPTLADPVQEMAACLKPGGRLVVSDFHYLCQVIGWRTAFSADSRRYHIENYIHTYGEFVRAFRDAGLGVVAVADIDFDERLLASASRQEAGRDPRSAAAPAPARQSEHPTQGCADIHAWRGFPLCMVIVGAK